MGHRGRGCREGEDNTSCRRRPLPKIFGSQGGVVKIDAKISSPHFIGGALHGLGGPGVKELAASHPESFYAFTGSCEITLASNSRGSHCSSKSSSWRSSHLRKKP